MIDTINDIGLSKLKDFLFLDEDINTEELAEILIKNREEGLKKKEECTKKCSKEFTTYIWNQLDEATKEHITTAYISCGEQYKKGYEISKTIQGLSGTLEIELRTKIFDDFNKSIMRFIDSYYEFFDDEYKDCLKKNFVPAKLLLAKLSILWMNYPKGIGGDLKKYLRDDWDTDMLSDEDWIKKAFEIVDIRNDHSHYSMVFDIEKFFEVKEKVVEVLKWFIEARY